MMGILDHRKTWHFSVAAPDKQCLQAFEQAMLHPGFKIFAASWHLERGTVSAVLGEAPWPASVATYQGRAGLIGVTSSLLETSRNEEQAAVGSQITFAINPASSGGRTECSMWLSSRSTTFGFTNDARFFRSYMQGVEKHLRALDPGLMVERS